LAEEPQLAARRVDREDRGVLTVAVGRVEEALLAIEAQPRRIDEVLDELDVLPAPRGLVHPVYVDAFASGVALPGRVATDVSEHRSPAFRRALASRAGARRRHRRAPSGHYRAGDSSQELSTAETLPSFGLTGGEHRDLRRAQGARMILDSG